MYEAKNTNRAASVEFVCISGQILRAAEPAMPSPKAGQSRRQSPKDFATI